MMATPEVVFIYTPLAIIATVVGISVPFATGRFIDMLVVGASQWGAFYTLAGLLLVKMAATPCLQRFILSQSREIELRLQTEALDAIMDHSPDELSVMSQGELVAKLTRDAYAVGGFFSRLYPRILTASVTMISAGCALYSRSAALSASFVVFIPFSIVLFIPFARKFADNSHTVRTRSDKSFTTLFDFLRSLPFLRTLDAERRFADAPREALCSLKDGNAATDRLSIAFGLLLGAILVSGEVAVLAVAGALASEGKIPVGDVILYQMLFLSAVQSVQGIVSLLPEVATIREGIDSLKEIAKQNHPRHRGMRIESVKSVEFKNVSFSYPNGPYVLKDFSTSLHAGTATAIAGANGTGKTTLMKLAVGALKQQSGEILVNDTPISDLEEGFFRRAIGVVFQENLLVSGSIRDNITLRDPAFNEEAIAHAIAESGLRDVIKRLPNGLDTRVGIGGQSLSGGELQRLAIARALIRKPMILVLDEVTNHLDASARKGFKELLTQIVPGRVVLVVTHDVDLAELCKGKVYLQNAE